MPFKHFISFTNGSFTNGTFTNGNFTNGSFSGDGSGLTGLTENQIPLLDAAKINRGILPLARGGTGSGIQNFVDLSNPQNIGGTKSFTGTVNAVNLNVGSKPAATGEESLRIVRGIVLLSGLVAGQSGAGYSVPTHSTTSTITFNPPFPFNTTPTITATAADTTQAFHTTISNVSRTGFSIATWNNSNNGQRTSFHFIAIGSR